MSPTDKSVSETQVIVKARVPLVLRKVDNSCTSLIVGIIDMHTNMFRCHIEHEFVM